MRRFGICFLLVGSLFASRDLSAEVVSLPPARDNTLCESTSGALSNGSGRFLFSGTTLSMGRRRGVLAFDVAGHIPPGATVTSVRLTLHMSMTIAGNQQVELRKVLGDWGEGSSAAPGEEGGCAPSAPRDATWVHRFFDSESWTTPGGDFDSTASAARTVGANGFYDWGSTAQMVADVQSWLDEPATNFGWLLLGGEAGVATAKRFDSRENPDTSLRPVLTITYVSPSTCEMNLRFDAATGTLTMGFELGAAARAKWSVWIAAGSGLFPLWSLDVPTLVPAVAFGIPIPGFPDLGNVGFLDTLASDDGVVCADWKFVDTTRR